MPNQQKLYSRRGLTTGMLALLATLTFSSAAVHAQDKYPNHSIRFVVGFAPGGPTDVQARLLATKLSPILGQTIVVENKPGASTTIATAEVAKANPDGYTLYFGGSGAYATTPLTIPKLSYNVSNSFKPVAMIGEEQIAFAVHPSVPAKNMTELVALIKANPGKYSYASSGNGNITHLTGELLKQHVGGLDFVHVAYKGAAPAVNDVLAGHVQIIVGGLGSVYRQHEAGKLRILAITSEKRVSYANDIPTANESGIKDLVSSSTLVLLAPAKTPDTVINTLSQAIGKALTDPAYLEEMRVASVEPITDSTPASTGQLLDREIAQWERLVKTSGLTIQ